MRRLAASGGLCLPAQAHRGLGKSTLLFDFETGCLCVAPVVLKLTL